MTTIEWTQRPGTKGETLNPTTGCDKISPGCGLPRFEGDLTGGCYAMAMAKRLKAMGQPKYQTDGDPRTSGPGFGLAIHPDELAKPLRWKSPRTVFVNSMSDLGHAKVPREFLARFWAVMAGTPQHTYQILSKRPERMARFVNDECRCGNGHPAGTHLMSAMSWAATPHNPDYVPGLSLAKVTEATRGMTWGKPLSNCWLGTSIELDEYCRRADHLRNTPAAVRFISAEPLLGPLPSLDLTSIDWLIIGGESGPGSRPMELAWVYDLIANARQSGTAVFVKQVGTVLAGGGKGGDWSKWPADLRIREYPQTVEAVAS